MRVAIDGRVITDHFPGIARYAYQLVLALSEVAPDDTFLVLCSRGQRSGRHELGALAQRSNVSLVETASGVFNPAAQWQVRRALRASAPDVFHATYWLSAYWPGRPMVLSLYDLIGARVPGSVPRARTVALDAAVRLALRRAGHVLTLSEWSKRDICAFAAVPRPRVSVTPLAADARFRLPTQAAVDALRRRLGLPPRYVLYVGINKPHKNLATLIRAWGRLTEGAPGSVTPAASSEAALVIAGHWDSRYDELRQLAAALPALAVTRFLGPVAEADLPTLYGGASAFAFPSRYEGFGLPPLEAMACGAPVVSSDATSLPEVVGDAGLLVGADDIDGWAGALRRVLSDGDLREQLRAQGLAQASRFSWSRTAHLTLDAYRRLAGQGGST